MNKEIKPGVWVQIKIKDKIETVKVDDVVGDDFQFRFNDGQIWTARIEEILPGDFEHKVRSMTPYEIAMSMVTGLQKPVTFIDMSSFGHVKDGVCFGCAATNTIAKIEGFDETQIQKYLPDENKLDLFDATGFSNVTKRVETKKIANTQFIRTFEYAIDQLRMCQFEKANTFLKDINLPVFKIPIFILLPFLSNEYRKEDLLQWRKFARYQIKVGNTKTSYDL